MEGPSLVVVPPTPLGYKLDPSPSTTASSSPDLSRLTSEEQERGSSETTIFTIYSMYSDEGTKRNDEGTGQNIAVTDLGSRLSNVRNGKNSNSTYQHSVRSTNNEMVYDGASSDGEASSNYASAADVPARASVISNGSVHLSYLDERPLSTHSSSSGFRSNNALKSSDTLRSSKFKDLPSPPNNINRTSYISSGAEA